MLVAALNAFTVYLTFRRRCRRDYCAQGGSWRWPGTGAGDRAANRRACPRAPGACQGLAVPGPGGRGRQGTADRTGEARRPAARAGTGGTGGSRGSTGTGGSRGGTGTGGSRGGTGTGGPRGGTGAGGPRSGTGTGGPRGGTAARGGSGTGRPRAGSRPSADGSSASGTRASGGRRCGRRKPGPHQPRWHGWRRSGGPCRQPADRRPDQRRQQGRHWRAFRIQAPAAVGRRRAGQPLWRPAEPAQRTSQIWFRTTRPRPLRKPQPTGSQQPDEQPGTTDPRNVRAAVREEPLRTRAASASRAQEASVLVPVQRPHRGPRKRQVLVPAQRPHRGPGRRKVGGPVQIGRPRPGDRRSRGPKMRQRCGLRGHRRRHALGERRGHAQQPVRVRGARPEPAGRRPAASALLATGGRRFRQASPPTSWTPRRERSSERCRETWPTPWPSGSWPLAWKRILRRHTGMRRRRASLRRGSASCARPPASRRTAPANGPTR